LKTNEDIGFCFVNVEEEEKARELEGVKVLGPTENGNI
jgi:hypothetical protein